MPKPKSTIDKTDGEQPDQAVLQEVEVAKDETPDVVDASAYPERPYDEAKIQDGVRPVGAYKVKEPVKTERQKALLAERPATDDSTSGQAGDGVHEDPPQGPPPVPPGGDGPNDPPPPADDA